MPPRRSSPVKTSACARHGAIHGSPDALGQTQAALSYTSLTKVLTAKCLRRHHLPEAFASSTVCWASQDLFVGSTAKYRMAESDNCNQVTAHRRFGSGAPHWSPRFGSA